MAKKKRSEPVRDNRTAVKVARPLTREPVLGADALTALPKGHPFKSKSVAAQERLLDQIWGILRNANEMEQGGHPNAAAVARGYAQRLYDGTYWTDK